MVAWFFLKKILKCCPSDWKYYLYIVILSLTSTKNYVWFIKKIVSINGDMIYKIQKRC